MNYQGHLTDGSSVQKHSAGGLYPFVIYAQQHGEALRYGVLKPNGESVLLSTYALAVQLATRLKFGSPQTRVAR